MISQETKEAIQAVIAETLEKMTFTDFNIEVRENENDERENVIFNIKTKDSNLLIGQQGATLKAIQHVVRVMLRKKIDERVKFLVDINNYRSQKTDSLEDLARSMARQAIEENRPMVMRPMSAYERRIIHMELASNDKVITESIGESEDRKVVIKPVGGIEELN